MDDEALFDELDELDALDEQNDPVHIELAATRARVAELEAENDQLRAGVAQARRLLNARIGNEV